VRPDVWELRVNGVSRRFRGGSKGAEKALQDLIRSTCRNASGATATFGELVDRWTADLEHYAKRTRDSYRNVIRLHLPERFRKRRVAELRVSDFDTLYRELTRAGTGAQTIVKLHTALSAALTEAIRWNWIDHNPAHRARLPKVPKTVGVAPPLDALARIVAIASDPKRRDLQCRVWIRLAVATGNRPGEAFALRWSRVNLRTGTIRIDAATEADGTLKHTKTEHSRTIEIDPDTIAVLRKWKTAQKNRAFGAGVPLAKDPFVLSNAADSGRPWLPHTASTRFRRLAKAAGAVGVRQYDLRHAHASMLLDEGTPVNVVADRLGNDPAVTLRVYGHPRATAGRAASDTIARVLLGINPVASDTTR